MHLPQPRGPLSAAVIADLAGRPTEPLADLVPPPRPDVLADVFTDGDLQLALWTLYELHYRGFDEVPDQREWDPALLTLRARLETVFEEALRQSTDAYVEQARDAHDDVVDQIIALTEDVEGAPVASYLQRRASRAQVLEFLAQRSLYHLKESDPHSLLLARIDGRPKAALAELLYDEYGAGRPERLHQDLFANALAGAGLDDGYGAYVDLTPATSLAVNNLMSLLGLHRRLRGAALGHLAAFEATSSVPCRRIAGGIERVGLPAVVAEYFTEHVEADSVHEQVALRDICGALVADHPDLHDDVLFGAAACLYLDGVAGRELLDDWERTDQQAAS
jgi:pyrroloquinoline quinone (PQQ) biosynthesis protein C